MRSIRRYSVPAVIQIEPVETFFRNENKTITQVNEYLLLKKIGSGGSSKIYVAFDTKEGKYYAVKQFKPASLCGIQSPFSQFEREIRNLSNFNHENILSLHEALFSEELMTAYLVLEWANCGSLDQYLESVSGIDPNALATIFSQVIAGIMHLHEKGIAHKDIKPSNILLFDDGTCKISDFGIGHSFQSADCVVGTPAYQAPEVFGDDEEEYEEDCFIDPVKEDVWSLGVSIYQTYFGGYPFTGANEYEIARSARQNPLQLDNTTPEDLAELLRGMLCVDPNKRFTMEQVAAHRFFQRKQSKKSLNFIPQRPPIMNADAKIRMITAQPCMDPATMRVLPLFKTGLYANNISLSLPPRAVSRA